MSARLTATEQADIARALADTTLTPADIAAIVGARDQADPYPEAFGYAAVVIDDLLAIIDALTGGAR